MAPELVPDVPPDPEAPLEDNAPPVEPEPLDDELLPFDEPLMELEPFVPLPLVPLMLFGPLESLEVLELPDLPELLDVLEPPYDIEPSLPLELVPDVPFDLDPVPVDPIAWEVDEQLLEFPFVALLPLVPLC